MAQRPVGLGGLVPQDPPRHPHCGSAPSCDALEAARSRKLNPEFLRVNLADKIVDGIGYRTAGWHRFRVLQPRHQLGYRKRPAKRFGDGRGKAPVGRVPWCVLTLP